MSILKCSTVLEVLKSLFSKVAHFDYAEKFTENEEDIRASIYRYIRNILDTDTTWRVFLSYSTKEGVMNPTLYKPDMVFFRNETNYQKVKVEIFVEIKNWPTIDEIQQDVNKLVTLKGHFLEDDPELVFLAILGTNFKEENTEDVELGIQNKFLNETKLHFCLEKHNDLYRGPWNKNKRTDPWREKLRWE